MRLVVEKMGVDALEIVVVNLARSSERRRAMEQSLAPLGLPYGFFEAVDGRAGLHPLFAHYDEHKALTRRGIPLSAGELGCFASHYILWQRCVSQDRPILICEDDIEIGPSFLEAYGIATGKISEYGLLRFSAHRSRRHTLCETVSRNLKIVRYERPVFGTSCYAISPQAARKLLQTAETWFEPVDLHLDRFWTHNVPIRGFLPTPVRHAADADEASEIRQSSMPVKKTSQYKLRRLAYKLWSEVRMSLHNLRYIGRWSNSN